MGATEKRRKTTVRFLLTPRNFAFTKEQKAYCLCVLLCKIFCRMTANNLDRAWIGAEYNTGTLTYSWSDKSLWSYTSWGTGQPTSSSTLLCAMQILQNGVTWQTRDCNGPEVAICKLNARSKFLSSCCIQRGKSCFCRKCKTQNHLISFHSLKRIVAKSDLFVYKTCYVEK